MILFYIVLGYLVISYLIKYFSKKRIDRIYTSIGSRILETENFICKLEKLNFPKTTIKYKEELLSEKKLHDSIDTYSMFNFKNEMIVSLEGICKEKDSLGVPPPTNTLLIRQKLNRKEFVLEKDFIITANSLDFYDSKMSSSRNRPLLTQFT